MEIDWGLFADLFGRTFTFWWVILPAILLGLIVGAIPGFSAANTIIILLPMTLAMEPEIGLIFMVALYASSRMGAGIPAILVNIPGTAGAAATPLDGYPMKEKKNKSGEHYAKYSPCSIISFSIVDWSFVTRISFLFLYIICL